MDAASGLPGDPDRPDHLRPRLLALVAAGGAAGAATRYGLARALPTSAGRFPWGTFVTNVSGAFVLALLLGTLAARAPQPGPTARGIRLVAGVGFLGAYTTYSTYAVEVDLAVRAGHPVLAAVYAAASLLTGLAAAAAGLRAAATLTRTRG